MRTISRWAMAHGFMETNPAGEASRRRVATNAEGEGTSSGRFTTRKSGLHSLTVSLIEVHVLEMNVESYRPKQCRQALTLVHH